MESALKDFRLPSCQQLFRDGFVRRVGASADLTPGHTHPHLPLVASLLLEEGSHLSGSEPRVGSDAGRQKGVDFATLQTTWSPSAIPRPRKTRVWFRHFWPQRKIRFLELHFSCPLH